jgi:hypothetical protein
MACNVWHGGMGVEFYPRMVKEVGQEEVDQLFQDKNKIVKALPHYEKLLKEYENL